MHAVQIRPNMFIVVDRSRIVFAYRRKARVPEIQPADEDDDEMTEGTLTPSQSSTPVGIADDWACDRTLQVSTPSKCLNDVRK